MVGIGVETSDQAEAERGWGQAEENEKAGEKSVSAKALIVAQHGQTRHNTKECWSTTQQIWTHEHGEKYVKRRTVVR